MKLVMTLLARNEEDIIRQNIEFHLRHGVDFIIATDNASDDGTRDILLEFQKKGVLRLIDEPGRDKSQAAWNNRMMRMAIDEYDADAVFHCDADEFWYPLLGDLKSEIFSAFEDVLSVEIVNVVPDMKIETSKKGFDSGFAVIRPIDADDYENESRGKNLYFYRYPPKVIFRAAKGYLEVSQGNHSVVTEQSDLKRGTSSNVCIFHFPLRGKERFYRKVKETGAAVEKNSLLNKCQSFHIRRWYEAYKEGRLDEEYRALLFSEREARAYFQSGAVTALTLNEVVEGSMSPSFTQGIQRSLFETAGNRFRREFQHKKSEIAAMKDDLQRKNQTISSLIQAVEQKDSEIAFVKSSKFWKFRNMYLRLKAKLSAIRKT